MARNQWQHACSSQQRQNCCLNIAVVWTKTLPEVCVGFVRRAPSLIAVAQSCQIGLLLAMTAMHSWLSLCCQSLCSSIQLCRCRRIRVVKQARRGHEQMLNTGFMTRATQSTSMRCAWKHSGGRSRRWDLVARVSLVQPLTLASMCCVVQSFVKSAGFKAVACTWLLSA